MVECIGMFFSCDGVVVIVCMMVEFVVFDEFVVLWVGGDV